ncbi:Glycosyl hydrolase, five-bladed beta-propellor domain superfamily [Fusarium oxysporum f. sp. vasinfectum]|nr:Glycosyl hydrolase, five-bladed beta-propellor domain superfamily [Fusarium oxysporum f. sp. vasinfectum]
MARSRDVWGPYEPCPENPILVPASKDMYIRHTGHCDVFEDENGQWWGVLLGVRRDKDGRYNMGRESHLTPAEWTDDWLRLESVKVTIDKSRLASANAVQGLTAVEGVDFLYIRDPILENYKIDSGSKTISVTSSSVDLSHPQESPSFVGKRQRLHAGQSSATFKINASSAEAKLKTGLAVYKDEHRYLRVFYDTAQKAVIYEFVNNAKDLKKTEQRALNKDADTIQFRFEYTEQEYRVFYTAGKGWEHIATLDTLDMTGPDFVGPAIGVFALAQESVTVEVVDLQVE